MAGETHPAGLLRRSESTLTHANPLTGRRHNVSQEVELAIYSRRPFNQQFSVQAVGSPATRLPSPANRCCSGGQFDESSTNRCSKASGAYRAQGGGRPALRTENPLVNLIPLLSLDRPRWFDDIVYGSIATSASTSQGRLNVRPGQVIAALHLRTISVAALGQQENSNRGLQAVAQAARHCLRGVEHYLHRHPQVRARLEAEIDPGSGTGN